MGKLFSWLPEGSLLKKLDWLVLVSGGLAVLVGLSTIQSTVLANPNQSTLLSGELITRQLLALLLGILVLFLFVALDYSYLVYLAPFFYLVALVSLGLVLFLGEEIRGAQRWIRIGAFNWQPAELSKVLFLVVFASLFSYLGNRINRAAYWILALVGVGLPMLLVYLEPDLGTMLVIGGVWLGLFYLSPIKKEKLLGFLGLLLVALPLTWNLLADYQRARVVAFLNPGADPFGIGYNLIQSEIAVGSGEVWGRGWGRGTQSHLQFLPEQHTDFIFATFAEEQGFFGAVVLLLLFAILLWRGVVIAHQAKDYLGQLLAWGVVLLFALQVFVNVAMNLGLAPITGIPLPLISYGGSALITHLAALGILESVVVHRA